VSSIFKEGRPALSDERRADCRAPQVTARRGKPFQRVGGLQAVAAWVLYVAGIAGCGSALETELTVGSSSRYQLAGDDVERLQTYLWRALQANEKQLVGRLGTVRGFGAGDVYPQIWLRDSATILPLSRYRYPFEYLATWLEEHLVHQAEDGQLFDWIASGSAAAFEPYAPRVREVYSSTSTDGKTLIICADKNSIEADQETSAVIAAHQVFEVTGDREWLQKPLQGVSLIGRLDHSLRYLLAHRLDSELELIVSGFSADWGDVSPIYPDQRAIYLDSETPRVVGLYTNAQFFRAARDLSELYGALQNVALQDFWEARAHTIRARMNQHLWQLDRGFYLVHRVVTPQLARGWQDDSDIFAMGGNALAALYGIASDDQARRIFEVASARQEELGVTTISGSLAPPYADGFFAHALLTREYSYQNGGQWDWFGGRLVLAAFERGEADLAYRKLAEIARKIVENDGLHEWHTRDGKGRGSGNYAGSAGALGDACFRGLFGVYLKAGGLDLKVRLGPRAGGVHVREPATGAYVVFTYHPGEELRLDYESSVAGRGSLSLLLPPGRSVVSLTIDGVELAYTIVKVGADTYVRVQTDWAHHLLKVVLV